MKKVFSILCLFAVLLLTGCLDYTTKTFKLDTEAGRFSFHYDDLRSIKTEGETASYSEQDWAMIKTHIQSPLKHFTTDEVSVISQRLFEKNGRLSGERIFQLNCPHCFDNKFELLKRVHADSGTWHQERGEYILIMAKQKGVITSNGRVLESPQHTIIVWPQSKTKFVYKVKNHMQSGLSLLPFLHAEE